MSELDLDALLSGENRASKAKPRRKIWRFLAMGTGLLAAGILLGVIAAAVFSPGQPDTSMAEHRLFLLYESNLPYYEAANGSILLAEEPITAEIAERMTTQRLAYIAVHMDGLADNYLAGDTSFYSDPVVQELDRRQDASQALLAWEDSEDFGIRSAAQILRVYCEWIKGG